MCVFKVGLLFLLIICAVKSDQIQCNDKYKDMKNETINVTRYCNDKSCIMKCCGDGQIFNAKGECDDAMRFQNYSSEIYSNTKIYSWEGITSKESVKNLTRDFVFVQNEKFAPSMCTDEYMYDTFYILENGTLRVETTSPSEWIDIQRLDYCIDYRLRRYKKNGSIHNRFKLIFRESRNMEPYRKDKFVVIATLTSCVFLLLVLAVYCLLRQLRNIVGMILMAYVSSLFVVFLMKAVLVLNIHSTNSNICKKITPILYYAVLSSFFWLNIMSFDVWWTLRGNRKCREIHRRGEMVKFGWYSLYAWGTPLGMTIATVILDNATAWPSFPKPSFHSCLANESSLYYLMVPIGVICVINVILFIMTAYNIWRIKSAIQNCQDSRKSEKDQNRFSIYIKLAVMMGVGWCLELIPSKSLNLWQFIVINFYNVFVGVAIFFLFVFKKSILIMLCRRLGINNKYVQNLAPQNSRSGTTKTTMSKSTESQALNQESTV